MRTSFFIALRTGQNYAPDKYQEKAGMLLNMALELFNTKERVAEFARGKVSSVHTEMEVSLEQYNLYNPSDWEATQGEWELILKAVIDVEGTGRLGIDKSKLSQFLRAHPNNEWGTALRIEKKAVPAGQMPGMLDQPSADQ